MGPGTPPCSSRWRLRRTAQSSSSRYAIFTVGLSTTLRSVPSSGVSGSVIFAMPEVVGHRLLWGELIFFAPTGPVGDVVRVILPFLIAPDGDIQIHAAVKLAPENPGDRIRFCDDL